MNFVLILAIVMFITGVVLFAHVSRVESFISRYEDRCRSDLKIFSTLGTYCDQLETDLSAVEARVRGIESLKHVKEIVINKEFTIPEESEEKDV